MAEAHAIRGLCLEHVQHGKSSSKFQRSQREDSINKAFERAADLAVAYLKELDSPGTGMPDRSGSVVDTVKLQARLKFFVVSRSFCD